MIDKSLWSPPSGDIPLDVPEQIAAKYSGSSGSSGSSPQSQDKIAAEVVAAIISGVVALGSTVAGGVSAHRANQTNINLTREAYARNLDQWQRENAYNSPLAQRQRLMAAGFNPALMYGGSGSLGTPSAASPQQESAKVNPYIFGNPLQGLPSDIAQTELLEAQKENIQADTKKKLAEVGFIDIETKNGALKLQVDQQWLDKLTQAQYRKFINETDLLGISIDKVQHEILNIDADRAIKLLEQDQLRKYINEIQPLEIRKLAAEVQVSEEEARNCVELIATKILLNKAQASQAYASAAYQNAMAKFQEKLNDSPDYIQAFINSQIFDSKLKGFQVTISENTDFRLDPDFVKKLGGNDSFLMKLHKFQYYWKYLAEGIFSGGMKIK